MEKSEFWRGFHEKPVYRGDCLKRRGLGSSQIQGEGGGGGGWQE